MYHCTSCGEQFKNPIEAPSERIEGINTDEDTIDVCPVCGSPFLSKISDKRAE